MKLNSLILFMSLIFSIQIILYLATSMSMCYNLNSEKGIIQSNGDIIEYNYNAIEKALSNLIYDSMINK